VCGGGGCGMKGVKGGVACWAVGGLLEDFGWPTGQCSADQEAW
jgi:hypothetical protein